MQTTLSKGYNPSPKEWRILVRACSLFILAKSDRPGEAGMILQLANKLVAKYPSLADKNEQGDKSVGKLYKMILIIIQETNTQ